MSTRMLVDARHPEETRVAVLKGNRIEEFDFDSADHKQIKGNIYLAKVTRVEPSLQAAFVDFGGNRHGFLAFSEIHPDYYQIPKEDREALLAEEAAYAEEEAAQRASDEEEDDARGESGEGDYADDYAGEDGVTEIDTSEKDQVSTIEDGHVDNDFDDDGGDDDRDEDGEDTSAEDEDSEGNRRGRGGDRGPNGGRGDNRGRGGDRGGDRGRGRRQGRSGQAPARAQADELRAKRMELRRRYKIQDVIHRRQVLLVQVVKEERGNKGAALTTYLSLAGRYCVLMPNSSHGGGISRKISSVTDRKRLKSIISEMDLPKSMGCIVRTAGLSRTKVEIKRDFDYLARLWDEIRETTLGSSAPALIHSDSDLIKRAIRDIYNKEIEEVVVEGEAGFRAARDFMKLLMPSHARRVKAYIDPVPLFQRYGAEDQLSAMYDPVVQLKSGGYIVINPTEALVSIDINSGRSTKEHGIEATAVNTNLEAAREIARQLRLRDMAGLVVIDFIDMEYSSNIRKVEKAMKDALKNDRARIQVGRISGFGLMEMSRQRLRTGVLEATTRACPHCDGTGLVRTAGSSGLSALRMIEDEAAKGNGTTITLFASQEAAIYVLNTKRADLAEIEDRYGVTVEVIPEGENEGAKMRVTSSGPRNEFVPRFEAISFAEEEDDDLPYEDEDDEETEAEEQARRERGDDGSDGEGGSGRRKRRKRRRGSRREDGDNAEPSGAEQRPQDDYASSGEDDDSDEGDSGDSDDGEDDGDQPRQVGDEVVEGEAPRKRRRRGRRRRGGRNREDGSEGSGSDQPEDGQSEDGQFDDGQAVGDYGDASDDGASQPDAEAAAEPEAEEAAPKPRTRRRRKPVSAGEAQAVSAEVEAPVEAEAEASAEAEAPKKRARRKKAEPASDAPVVEAEAVADAAEPAAEKPKRPRRKKAVAAEAPADDAATAEAPVAEAPVAEAPATVEAPEAPATDTVPSPESNEPVGDGAPRRSGWWQRTFGE